jgi:3-ketosteroid 9alpha-monooxygenase subunit B
VVTAKRIAGGRGSTWLCDELHVGDMVEVLRPAGVFTPDDLGRDLLLVAAGSGITPVISIAESALRAGGGKVTLLYANRDDRSVIFAERLADLVRRYPDRLTVIHWLESLEGIPEPVTLGARLAPFADREVFVCGPAPFMDVVSQACASIGVPGSDIHIEEFVSLAGDPFEIGQPLDGLDLEDAAEVEVELDGQTTTVAWPRARVLLDALLAAGIDAPFSCREGACSACACVVTVGEVEMATNDILQEEDVREGVILSCQARPLTDKVRVTYDL